MVGVCACLFATAQNPATVFTIPQKNIYLACGTTCTSINVQVPHIKEATDYVITNPAYMPFAYTTPAGTEVTALYDDDVWSSVIPFPFAFSFCFYGSTYPSVLMGSNGNLTFDVSRAEDGSGYSIDPGGTIPSGDYAPLSIFGPYHDINPNLTSANKKIEYRVEGNAPYRRFIASYNDVPYFSDDCDDPGFRATHQTVLYENTGIIEVYIKDKPYCVEWNDGLTILGVQNGDYTKGVAAAGKNATVWGQSGMDSCFRFIPSGGAARFRRAELLVNNVVIATNTTDTSTASPGSLNLNFNNICPTADSTAYVIRVVYGSCSNPALSVSFTDTVFVKKSTLTATVSSTNATCTENGSITINASGGAGQLQYSIDGGANYYTYSAFNDLPAGSYNVITTDGLASCPVATPVVITQVGTVSVSAGADTTICRGASFTRTAQIAGGSSFTWSPSDGVSSTTTATAVFSPQTTTTYTIDASTLNCPAQDAFTVTVVEGATANAGADAFVLANASYQLSGSGSSGTYLWTPSAGLNNPNILNPTAQPSQTTTYTLNITTPQGCTASDEVTLTVVPYCIKPMNAFTPNGDGINDLWLVTNGNCLEKATAQVFNRYGSKVFESNDYKNDWNGTYKGDPLADGTYYFVITYKLINGKTEYLKGNVTILR